MKLTDKEKAQNILKQLKEEFGIVIKDSDTGIYFKTTGNGKLQTSLNIHINAGGDPALFKAWSDAQNKLH